MQTGLMAVRYFAASVAALLAAGAMPCEVQAEPVPSLPFVLAKPVGLGRFPAVVVLHDCSGVGPQSSGAPVRWSVELLALGYVTIRPDSFSPRGRPTGVCTDNSPPVIGYRTRAADAHEMLQYLQSLPFVDPNRIGVMGNSHGGSATLGAIVAAADNEKTKPGFAAAIALYPGCVARYGDWMVTRENGPGTPIKDYAGVFRPLAPLLILTGELDDWTPAEPCRRLSETATAAGHPVDIKIYPGAHHAFDSRAPLRFIAERVNFNAPGGHGATTGGHQESWDDAKIQVREFFARHLKGSP